MKHLLVLWLVGAMTSLGLIYQSDYLEAREVTTLDSEISSVEQKVIHWRRQIHQNPELSNREVETAKLVSGHLRKLDIEVQTGVGVHGVVEVLKGGKPGDKVVALRADLDANAVKELVDVPFKSTRVDTDWRESETPVMHACGHDAHVAMLMGAAEVLARMREHIPGSVKFIFQGAEEGPPGDEEGGASMMVEQGVLENPRPDMVFAIHMSPKPNNVVTYVTGTASVNSYKLSIKINGMLGLIPI